MNNVSQTNRTDIVIRDMRPDDVDRILELEQLIFPDPWPRSAFVEQVSGEGWGGYVAVSQGTIVGYLCTLIADTESHITNIAVLPEYRRHGIATLLLEPFLRLVSGTRVEYILLEVRAGNREAQAFYERHGFRFLYRRNKYYRRPIEDALVLVRDVTPRSSGE